VVPEDHSATRFSSGCDLESNRLAKDMFRQESNFAGMCRRLSF
jgi:hypothetical protein